MANQSVSKWLPGFSTVGFLRARIQVSMRGMLRICILAGLLCGTSIAVLGQTGPAFSTQTPTISNTATTFSVFLPLVNSGNSAATKVQVSSAKFGPATLIGPSLPLALGSIQSGAFVWIFLDFNPIGLNSGQGYLLTVGGTYQLGGSTLGFQVNRIIKFGTDLFHLPANPLNVVPTLGATHAVAQTVSAANGGTVTATGADGSTYSVKIPANALLSDEQITLTPIQSIAGLPPSAGFAAGVQLEPEGLQLLSPATLTIQLAANLPISQQLGFSYDSVGRDFHLYPLGLQSAVTMKIFHFSGYGVWDSTSAANLVYIAGQNQSRLDAAIAQLTGSQRIAQVSGMLPSNPQFNAQLDGILQDYYTSVVQLLLEAALSDDTFADIALITAAIWEQEVELLSSDPQRFASEIAALQAAREEIITNAYNRAFERCVNLMGNRAVEGQKMQDYFRHFELLIGDAADAFPDFDKQLASCLAGPLQFSLGSMVSGTEIALAGGTSVTVNSSSDVAAQEFPLNFDATSLAYTGSGALDYKSREFSINWGRAPVSDCSSGFGNPGTIAVKAEFDLNIKPSAGTNANELRMHVTLAPTITETDTVCEIDKFGEHSSPPSIDTFYTNFLNLAHGSESGPPTISPYFLNINTPKTFTFSNSAATPIGVDTANESSTLTLTQTSP